jgi:hypothetical protein
MWIIFISFTSTFFSTPPLTPPLAPPSPQKLNLFVIKGPIVTLEIRKFMQVRKFMQIYSKFMQRKNFCKLKFLRKKYGRVFW